MFCNAGSFPEPLANGFCSGEGPRWFEGLLWLAIACALGGPRHRTLFLLSSTDAHPQRLVGTRLSRVDAAAVTVPGAGLP
ncbi:hypothetical protein AWC19_18960 [Mycobacterium palustre]|uniref:Uncharacterized protein n=1 Tax=Mycobacterium palustre TaxID=153971 RepID=A0A1X1Z6C8_9MYCO|nr:hypothetical protein AWC19_18960 [Mycobacterium palustre]